MPRTKISPLSALLPGGSLISGLFDCMGIAEEEIARAKLTKAQGSRAFGALCPSEPLRGKSEALYRAHAREICARVKVGAPLGLATDAECLAVMSNTSLIAPLGQNATAGAESLFVKLFPASAIAADMKRRPGYGGESWNGAAYEAITEVRRKFAVPSRDEKGEP